MKKRLTRQFKRTSRARIKSPYSAQRAFTLIELMIVIVIIAILALIVIPKISTVVRRSREATMVENVHIIREAIERFHADTDEYPASINGLVAAAGSTPAGALSPTGVRSGSYQGPYLRQEGGIGGGSIPKNPLVPNSLLVDETNNMPANPPEAHWAYIPATGNIFSGISGTTVDGIDYNNL